MSKNGATFDAIVSEIAGSVESSPKKQRRLLSKTFWGRLGYKTRTKERVSAVKDAFARRGIEIDAGGELGSEDKESWITLSLISDTSKPRDVPLPPPDEWFELMATRKYESEREVEFYFVIPLLEKLGYVEEDIAVGYPVTMYEGVRRVNKIADLVLFDGPSRDDALIVVEAKKMGRRLDADTIGQAKAYAMWLATPYYVVTNGELTRVIRNRGPHRSNVPEIIIHRSNLKSEWSDLAKLLVKQNVLDYKRRLDEYLKAIQQHRI